MAKPINFKINVDASKFALELGEFAQSVYKFNRAVGDFESATGVTVDVSVVVTMPPEVKGVTVGLDMSDKPDMTAHVPVMPAAKAQVVAAEITESARQSLDFADAKREGMEPKVSKVGQVWKMRDGETVTVTRIHNDDRSYPVECETEDDCHTYTSKGQYYDTGTPSDFDLVELVSE